MLEGLQFSKCKKSGEKGSDGEESGEDKKKLLPFLEIAVGHMDAQLYFWKSCCRSGCPAKKKERLETMLTADKLKHKSVQLHKLFCAKTAAC